MAAVSATGWAPLPAGASPAGAAPVQTVSAACAPLGAGPPPTDACPAAATTAQIEVLPYDDCGDTSQGFTSTRDTYDTGFCFLGGVTYSGPDAIYEVRLHEGNEVEFRLDVSPGADLVLALVRDCADETSCVRSTLDRIGSDTEVIPRARYPEGIYYLYVDSADVAAPGGYHLSVTGFNPTPDLVTSLTTLGEAGTGRVVAGESLTYSLTVANRGELDATGVVATLALPPGVALEEAPGCDGPRNGTVTCALGPLARGASAAREVRVRVDPATRGSLSAVAAADADEGEPTPGDNRAELETEVSARSDLVLAKRASPGPVVAGETLGYTLTVTNRGPSDANGVVVTDPLDGDVEAVEGLDGGCAVEGRQVRCGISRLRPGARKSWSYTVRVAPAAADGARLLNHATAAVTGEDQDTNPDPDLSNNQAETSTEVIRRTDLSITKEGPGAITAGKNLAYHIQVTNHGPSESSGATVTDALPGGLSLVSASEGWDCPAPGASSVACTIAGPIEPGEFRSLTLQVHVPSGLGPTTLTNVARVAGHETEPDGRGGDNDSTPVSTTVSIEADLALENKTATPVAELGVAPEDATGTVFAGANLLYTIEVRNHGPSDSHGGRIEDALDASLTFVSSPDGCGQPDPADDTVVCPLPRLEPGEPFSARVVVRVAPGTAESAISNQASVMALDSDHDPDGNNNRLDASTETEVERKADLEVTLDATPDPVVAGENLLYTLSVRNAGPSDATGVQATLELPDGVRLNGQRTCAVDDGTVMCDLGDLPAGGEPVRRQVQVRVLPQTDGPLTTSATVTADTASSHDEETTTVVRRSQAGQQADLAVRLSVGVDGVVRGDLLRYTLAVTNHGPARADGVTVADTLPEGARLLPDGLPDGCLGTEIEGSPPEVRCQLGPLPVDQTRSRVLTVQVDGPGEGSPPAVVNTAEIPAPRSKDPNPANDSATVATSVIQAPPLVLPVYEAAKAENGAATLFAVRNASHAAAEVRFDYVPSDGPSGSVASSRTLKSQQTIAVNLRDLEGLLPESGVGTGFVGITPQVQQSEPEPLLTGDYSRLNPEGGYATGDLLLATDTFRRPPGLCRRWDVRFLQGGPPGVSTDLLFFIPGAPDAGGGETLRGTVFTEAGAFVQQVQLTAPTRAFTWSTSPRPGSHGPAFDRDVPLLAASGTLEWDFGEGVLGSVTAVQRTADGLAVTVPGTCRTPPSGDDPALAAELVLPYFEVDPQQRLSGVTTLFAVHNAAEHEVVVRYEYHAAGGNLLRDPPETAALASHATRTVNLRDVGLGDSTAGFVRVRALGKDSSTEEPVLSGDFALLDPADGLAVGGALVDPGKEGSQRGLCNRWDTRFLEDGASGTRHTDFVFFVDRGSEDPTVTGKVFGDDGDMADSISVSTGDSAFRRSAEDLGLSGSGSVEWKIQEGLRGTVAAIFRMPGGLAVLVPGVCRDPSE